MNVWMDGWIKQSVLAILFVFVYTCTVLLPPIWTLYDAISQASERASTK